MRSLYVCRVTHSPVQGMLFFPFFGTEVTASWILQPGDWHPLNTEMIDEISCQLESWVGNAGDRGRIPGFHLCLTQCVILSSKCKSNQGML